MKFFLQYLRSRWKIIAMQVLFAGIFLLTFALYQIPLEVVLYPCTLCVFVSILILFMDFRKARKQHMLLEHVRDFTDIVDDVFSQADSIQNEDYQRIIKLLHEEHRNYQNVTNQKYSDMIDYYTIWVHQIKTPIASMRLTLQNEDSPLSRKLTTDLFRIEQYVEMVLVYLRLESEGSDYVIREYDLDAVIRQTVKKFSGEFISRKIRLVYEPLHTKIITDEKWFSFVIEQLLSNALKYTSSGSITIKMEGKKLCIQDTGMGIAPEDVPRIFEKGFTGYNGRTDKKASGIGLYLCRRICTNLGYAIKAESVVGEGTMVVIDLTQKRLEVE